MSVDSRDGSDERVGRSRRAGQRGTRRCRRERAGSRAGAPRHAGRRASAALAAMVLAAGLTSVTAAAAGASGGKSSPKAQFKAMVASARRSNHDVAVGLLGTTPTEVKAWETGFKKAFGFPVNLVNVPGHTSLTIPTKIVAAGHSKGVADYVIGSLPYEMDLLNGGFFKKMNFNALEYKWPEVKSLRSMVSPDLSLPDGTKAKTYCISSDQSPYVITYNKQQVTAAQAKKITWQTLLTKQYQGKVAVDAKGGQTAYVALSPQYGLKGAKLYVQKLVANKAIPVAGGSAGVVQAVVSGQAALGFGVLDIVQAQQLAGAPIGYVLAPISPKIHQIPVDDEVGCLVTPGVNNADMAALFMTWQLVDGYKLTASMGGPQRLDAQEASSFPSAKQMKTAGYTQADWLFERTFANITTYTEAMTTGGKQLAGES